MGQGSLGKGRPEASEAGVVLGVVQIPATLVWQQGAWEDTVGSPFIQEL